MSQTSSTPSSQAEQVDKRLNKRLKDMPVAIVGMASMFANSRYLNKFWDLISEKIDAITEVPETHWQTADYYDSNKSSPDKSYCKRGGFIPEVDFNPMEFGLPPNILELTDTSQLLSLIVAKEVLEDAKLPEGYDRDKIGITLGVGGGQKISQSLNSRLQYPVLKKVFKHSGISDEDSEMLIKKFQDQYIHWEENSFPGSLGNVIAGRIANRFDLGGMNCVVDAACAGSLAAMRMALTELVEGRSEMMITGGTCTDNSPSMYMSFSKTPAFTTNETIQPFDIDSKGMMIGEGIGMVVLKRLEDAERDGDRIYSVIKGIGASSDGKFKSIYAPRPEGQAKALKRAYDDAGFPPHTLGLIEAHGTGTAAGDAAEFNGLRSVFSEECDTKQHIALGSVKSQIGHTKSTAGTAGLIKAALALHHKVLPATINVSQPNPKLDIENSPFYLNTETRPWMPRVDGTPRRAGISSFGFGGTNFHIVLEEHKLDHGRDSAYRQRQVGQTLLFSAPSQAELIASLKQIQSSTTDADMQQLGKDHGLRTLDVNAPRLGLVAATASELNASLKQAIAKLEASDEAKWQLPGGLFYRASALVNANQPQAKIAALFSGQGSQYLNMGRELACHFPEMRNQLIQADNVFAANDKTPLSSLLYPRPVFNKEDKQAQEAQLTNTANAQSAIGVMSMGQYSLLTAAGFSADMFAGHSFGELSALCAAGVISQADYYQLAFARGQAMAAKPAEGADTGAMAAVITKQAGDLEALETCIAKFDGVKIANFNAPTQLVIAGPTDSVSEATKAISQLGFKAIPLPVSGAFHTPLVGHAQAPFAAAIDKVKFTKASQPLYSNATGALHKKDAKSVKAAFKQHMLQSVHFSKQLETMYDDGARIFVEFGPKNILQKLVENTLGNKSEELVAISMNASPKNDSDSQLRLAAIQLAVVGIELNNIDPYQAQITPPAKPSPMNIKLVAANYVSDVTRAKMAKSLQTGQITSQIVEKPVERIVEVEKLVEKIVEVEKLIEVEKIVEVAVAAQGQAPMPALAQTNTVRDVEVKNTPVQSQVIAPVDASPLAQFFAAQQQAAQLHQQFLTIPQQYQQTVTNVMAEQTKLASQGVAIPQGLQDSMTMFHQHQAETLKSHAQFLELQASSNQSALQMLTGVITAPVITAPAVVTQTVVAPVAIAPAVAAPVVSTPTQAAPQQIAPQAAKPALVMQQAAMVKTQVQPVPVVAPAPVAAPVVVAPVTASADAEKVMLAVVAEKTGYPTEMLDLSMDMEADLGIDSIKRVEILGTVQDEMPNLPELSPEDLAECRTLGEIVNYMNSKLGAAPAPASATPVAATGLSATVSSAPAASLSAALVESTMMSVVADKTGYPTEMLALEMDMEADLGIDSIKRVEILGTVQDELPSLPELSPEDLAECRTLGEIVNYMNSKLGAAPAPTSAAPAIATATGLSATVSSAPAASLSAALVESTMMSVVADKTGYPTEMLALEMDMEADLGIDSIKRVEILGTVQDELPSLPELSPEDLAECRTLGEIVAYMNTKISSGLDTVAASSASAAPVAAPATGLSAAVVEQTMMSVVADKTGYPTEMLALEMDMEADLGIDSIKRVEILGTVQDELPGLPELNPEDLAECRTLGEIVAYMNTKINTGLGGVAASPVEVASIAPISAEPSVELPPHSEVALKKLKSASKLASSFVDAKLGLFSQDDTVVIADDGHNAGVLAQKLDKLGLKVAVIRLPGKAPQSPLSSDVASYQAKDYSQGAIESLISDISQQGNIAGFIHLQPNEAIESTSAVKLTDAGKQHLEQAFLWAKLLQPVLTVNSDKRHAFITVSRIDGGFGYLDNQLLQTAELNQAALAGLTKTLSHEWPSVFCRALDIAPALDASQMAEAIAYELSDTQTQASEVGISLDGRHQLIASKSDLQTQAASLDRSDKILVTGGAKGVTFECALALAKRCQSHFILAGRSEHSSLPQWAQGKQVGELKSAAIAHLLATGSKPTPKQVDALIWPVQSSLEISQSLAAFTAVGASAEYISMDVTSEQAINTALTSNKDQVTGLIHGAGVLADKHIQDKTLDELARVYGTKVNGLKALLATLDSSKLKLLAMFSSAAGFYGNTGQSDYSMSNEILNKAALQFQAVHPTAKVMSFNWGPWDGGMVNPALKKMFTDRGVYVIPLQAGAELFATQLLGETGIQLLVGTDMQGNDSSKQDAANAKSEANSVKKPKAAPATNHAAGSLSQAKTLTLTLVPSEMAFVYDHVIGGNPVLPTVCALQWMRQAANQATGQVYSISQYKLLKGVVFEGAETSDAVEMSLVLSPETGMEISALISAAGRPQYQATLVPIADLAQVSQALSGSAEDYQQFTTLNSITDAARLYSDGTLFHGTRLQGIQNVVKFDDASLVATCTMPKIAEQDCGPFVPTTELGGYQPFAEDYLLQAMLIWAKLKHDAASLPSAIGEFISYSPMSSGEQGWLALDVVKSSSRQLVADIRLYHQDGRISAEIKGAKVTISKSINAAFQANKANHSLAEAQRG